MRRETRVAWRSLDSPILRGGILAVNRRLFVLLSVALLLSLGGFPPARTVLASTSASSGSATGGTTPGGGPETGGAGSGGRKVPKSQSLTKKGSP
jgi:hypothetical protein